MILRNPTADINNMIPLNKTTKVALSLFLALMAAKTSAQECAYSRNTIDGFTKERILVTEPQSIHHETPNSLSFMLSNVDGKLGLKVEYQTVTTDRHQKFCYTDQSTISFLMMNGDVVTLPFVGNDQCNKSSHVLEGDATSTYRRAIYTNWIEGDFAISQNADTLNMLTGTIKQIRIQFDESTLDVQVNSTIRSNRPSGGKLRGHKKLNPQLYFRHFLKCVTLPGSE